MLHLETEETFNIDKFMMDKVFEKQELATCFEQWSAHLRPLEQLPEELPVKQPSEEI
jgi:hypothetical protein